MNLLIHIANAAADHGAKILYDYGYRDSFGKTCVGIVCSVQLSQEVLKTVIKSLHEEALDHHDDDDDENEDVFGFAKCIDTLIGYNMDSMGHNVIMYWPSLIMYLPSLTNPE